MALTPEDVVNKRFQATKFREGYDQDEVDDFLDEVVNELRRLNEENDELRTKLTSCERRVGELSRATVAREAAPEPVAAAPAPVVVPPPAPAPVPQPVAAVAPEPSRVTSQLEAAGQGPEAAAGMLALAQKLHDEYVRNGEQQRDRIVGLHSGPEVTWTRAGGTSWSGTSRSFSTTRPRRRRRAAPG